MKEIKRQKSLLEECFMRNGIACDRITCRESKTYSRMRIDLAPDACGHLPVGLTFGSRPVYVGGSLLVLGDPGTGKSSLLKSMMRAVPEDAQRIHLCSEKDAEEGSVTGRGAASERLAALVAEVLRRHASKETSPVINVFVDDADLLVGGDEPDMQTARDLLTIVKDGPKVGIRTFVSISSLDWSLAQLFMFNCGDVFSFRQEDPSRFFSDYVAGLLPHEGLFYRDKVRKTYVRYVRSDQQ